MTDRRNDYYSYAPFHVQFSYWGKICRLCTHFPFHEAPGRHFCDRRGTAGRMVQRNSLGTKICFEKISEGEFHLRMDTQWVRDAAYARVCSFNYKSVRRKELSEKQKIYVSLHREEVLLKKRAYYHKNREYQRAWHKENYQANKEKIKARVNAYRKTLTPEQIKRLRELEKIARRARQTLVWSP